MNTWNWHWGVQVGKVRDLREPWQRDKVKEGSSPSAVCTDNLAMNRPMCLLLWYLKDMVLLYFYFSFTLFNQIKISLVQSFRMENRRLA